MARATQAFLDKHPMDKDAPKSTGPTENSGVEAILPHQLLDAREFFATNMSPDVLSVSLPLTSLFRTLADKCKSLIVELEQPYELGDVVGHIVAATDDAFKPVYVNTILEFVDDGKHEVEMGVLFPKAGGGIDTEHAVRALQMRTTIIYELLHELTVSTQFKVVLSLQDIGHDFPIHVSAIETTIVGFSKRSVFWTALWMALGMMGLAHRHDTGSSAAMRILADSHAIASGTLEIREMPESEQAVTEADMPAPTDVQVVGADPKADKADTMESDGRLELEKAGCSFIGHAAKPLFLESKTKQTSWRCLTFFEVGRLNAVQSHVTAAIMMQALDSLQCDGIAIETNPGTKKDHISMPTASPLCLPFWGRVVFSIANLPKFLPHVTLGLAYGATMFLIPDDHYPCYAWSVPSSSDAAECNCRVTFFKVEATMPFTDEKSKKVVLTIDVPQLTPADQTGGTIGGMSSADRVALVRDAAKDDPKNLPKRIEFCMADLSKHVQTFKETAGLAVVEPSATNPSNSKRARTSSSTIPS